MISICLCIWYLLFGSSSLPTKGKRRFYICVLVQRKIAVWVAKKPDIIGLFARDIFFVSTLWSECGDSNTRHLAPKRIYEGAFRRKWLFPPLSARKTALFSTLVSTVSECSETVGGLLCGQQQFPQNNTHYTPFVITREAIAFYTVIITLNNPWFKSKFAPQ